MSFDSLFDFPKFPNAKCANEDDQDFFFPDSLIQWEERLPQLRHYCGTCAHRADCLSYAIKNDINEGFWGGKTPNERELISLQENRKEDKKNKRFREIQHFLQLGFSKSEVATKLGIQLESLERTLDRAKQRGLL